MLTFGSLFAGIGGLDLGLERAGMQCKWQVEINPYGQRVLAKHWPEVRRHDDIKTWPTEDAERVDLICGGFPCQDISYAGKGAGLAGERSGLFYELVRVVSEMGPKYVLLENVAALLVRGLDDVLGTLAAIGYNAEWHCIPAAAVGAPHIRDRVFILAYSNGRDGGDEPDNIGENGSRCISDNIRSSGIDSADVADTDREPLFSLRTQSGIGKGEKVHIGAWATEPDVGRVVDGVPKRVDRLRGLGNAVVPQVAELIGRAIVEHHTH